MIPSSDWPSARTARSWRRAAATAWCTCGISPAASSNTPSKITPTGSWAFTSGPTARLWRPPAATRPPRSGTCVAKESILTFPDHQNVVYAVAMTPDGKYGISSGDDSSIRIWQAFDPNSKTYGKQSKTLTGHAKGVFRLAVNYADAKNPLLASCGADMTRAALEPRVGETAQDAYRAFRLGLRGRHSARTASSSRAAPPTARCESGRRPTAASSPTSTRRRDTRPPRPPRRRRNRPNLNHGAHGSHGKLRFPIF